MLSTAGSHQRQEASQLGGRGRLVASTLGRRLVARRPESRLVANKPKSEASHTSLRLGVSWCTARVLRGELGDSRETWVVEMMDLRGTGSVKGFQWNFHLKNATSWANSGSCLHMAVMSLKKSASSFRKMYFDTPKFQKQNI